MCFRSQKHKEKYTVVVEECLFIRPHINRIDNISNNCARGCYKNYFHTFIFECLYEIHMINGDFVIGRMSDEKFEKNALEDGFIRKLAIKIYSNLSNVNICFHLEFRIPKLHRQCSRIISQNREYVKIHCNDLRNPFHFACRRWT